MLFFSHLLRKQKTGSRGQFSKIQNRPNKLEIEIPLCATLFLTYLFVLKLLVIGGVDQNDPDSSKTTEIIDRNGAMPGPDLPCAFSHHCVTQINEISAIILGGISGIQPEATRTLWLELYYDHFSKTTEGPSMIGNGRINHACTTIRADNGSIYVIAAGGFKAVTLDGLDGEENPVLETSEILRIDNDLSGSFSPGKYEIIYIWIFM